MARRGRWGRRPRASVDLSATVAAMAREYQSARDRNIVNAWADGGKFEGRAVTDDMLLEHWADRRANVSPDDPLYDQYDQQYRQYEFSIRNQKMELAYAEGKKTDGAMSAFYRLEASKHPRESQEWRDLMKLAAQYKSRADAASGGGGGGGGRGRAPKVDYSPVLDNPSSGESVWNYIVNTIEEEQRINHILDETVDIDSPPGSTAGQNIGNLQVNEEDWGDTQDILNQLANSTDPRWVQHRETLNAFIRENVDATWDGNFDAAGLTHLYELSARGNDHRADLGAKHGNKTQQDNIARAGAYALRSFGVLRVTDSMDLYEKARAKWDLVNNDPFAEPLDKIKATQEYQQVMKIVGTDLGEAASDVPRNAYGRPVDGGWMAELYGRWGREWEALQGIDPGPRGLTLFENSNPAEMGGKAKPGEGDGETTALAVNEMYLMEARLTGTDLRTNKPIGEVDWGTDASGQRIDESGWYFGKYVMTRVDATGQVTPGKGSALRIDTVDAIRASAKGREVAFFSGMSTGHRPTATVAHTVRVVGLTGAGARPTTELRQAVGTRDDIGIVFNYPDGRTVYGIYDDVNGGLLYSAVAPWAENTVLEGGEDGGDMTLTLTTQGGMPNQQFAPTDGLDVTFGDPNVRGANKSLSRSSTVAYYQASENPVELADPKVAEEASAMLALESGGDPVKHVALQASLGSAINTAQGIRRAGVDVLVRGGGVGVGATGVGRMSATRSRFDSEFQDRFFGMGEDEDAAMRARGRFLLTGTTKAETLERQLTQNARYAMAGAGQAARGGSAIVPLLSGVEANRRVEAARQQAEGYVSPATLIARQYGEPVTAAQLRQTVAANQYAASLRGGYIPPYAQASPSVKPPAPTAPAPKPKAPPPPPVLDIEKLPMPEVISPPNQLPTKRKGRTGTTYEIL